ncbi:NifB-domain protein, type 2 [Methanosarcina barkeri str. Wiesmoor]|uniref:NifB-domain protein, type 2 n=2 Tax=Methanosarcina barkeri TaxID=2208 RepID=A0A0E3QL96_METBA|nr:NifB/NifX family molybdenum-iron cluster-binding protein [Methanosarcina barkeri]AKB51727.1 NifB-domain protein, type 2 [Methanosarcina barkeri str. Wiesmoor]
MDTCNMDTERTTLNEVEKQSSEKFKVAVTSKSGKLVDQHFGQTTDFMIFEINGEDYKFLETRSTKKYCNGGHELNNQSHGKKEAIETISDCDAVLSMKIGLGAQKKLGEFGIECIEYCYTVERGLKYLQTMRKQKQVKKISPHSTASFKINNFS